MNYLKKFITTNLYAIYGYWALIQIIYYFVSGYITLYPTVDTSLFWGTLINIIFNLLRLKYFLLVFLIEFIIRFLISKLLKKEIELHFSNKIYDFLFRFGIMASFIPITIMTIILFIYLPFSAILNLILGENIPDFVYDTIIIILNFCTFYLLTKYIFFRKK